jgi:serine/threonine protein kinase
MDYRRTSLVLNRQQQVVANPHIYASFGGGPTRNPNGVFESTTMWWDEERIEATVTRQFVMSNLRPDEQIRLDEPLGFGDGLTDDTYMEWIEEKAKRIFLILVDLGVPDQIFGVIDDSWDDDDLPVPLDQVGRLQLTYDRDEKLERRFFQRQFNYLLRNIQKGDHLVYDDEEVVPLELAEKRPVGAVAGFTQSHVEKVHLPNRPDDLFFRKRVPLGLTPGRMPQEEFLSGIESMKAIEHDHLSSLWASYIHEGCGYALLTPVADTNLKSILTVTPQFIKILAKQDRRILLLNWIHCLADALSFLHGQELAHKNIKPSNVMLDFDNHIFLGDAGIFSTSNLSGEKRGFDKEVYDYSAPEQAPRPPTTPPVSLPVSRPATARRSTAPSTASYSTTNYTYSDASSVYTSSTGSAHSYPPLKLHHHTHSGTRFDPQKADIFSLGAIFVEILTVLLKRTSRNFASHRAAKNKTPGRGGGLPDSSFHKNLGQVDSWMKTLAKDASKKDDKIFRGVEHLLDLCEKMLDPNPTMRPTAKEVQERVYKILSEDSGLGPVKNPSNEDEARGKIHCETRKTEEDAWNFGFDQLRLASQRAAAEACASVNPITANGGTLGVNSGVIYGVERTQSIISAMVQQEREREREREKERERLHGRNGSRGGGDGDHISITTKTSRSSEGKRTGNGSQGTHGTKMKPKAKAWQAPVYAGESFPHLDSSSAQVAATFLNGC